MKRFKLTMLVLALFCACAALSACVVIPNGGNDNDKKLDAPTDIIIQNITKNSFEVFDVIYGEEGGGATEISIDGIHWTDFDNKYGQIFDGLLPNSEYTVAARQKAYGNYSASEAFVKHVTTLRQATADVPEGILATIYHGTVTLSRVTSEMEVSYDNGVSYTNETTHTYTEKGEKTILVRFKETSGALAGKDAVIKIAYNDFAGGTGTNADPFLIENYSELAAINGYRYEATYKLMNDIRFPETTVTDIIVFSGTILGNNKKLISPRLDYSESNDYNAYGGIFHTNGVANIYDLTVEDAEMTTNSGKMVHGLLINEAKEIANCSVSGKINLSCASSHSYEVGGLCGEIRSAGSEIYSCKSDVSIEVSGDAASSFRFGGLVGKISADCAITFGNAWIAVSNDAIKPMYAFGGGLVGSVENATAVTISKSCANVHLDLTAIKCYAGGLVATAQNTSFLNCYATGSITASGMAINPQSVCNVGGITAAITGNSAHAGIANCYSSVDFTLDRANSQVVAAGIICNITGKNRKIENCIFAGSINLSEGEKSASAYAIIVQTNSNSAVNNVVLDSSAEGIDATNVTVMSQSGFTVKFFKETMKFDETVWELRNGVLPEFISQE